MLLVLGITVLAAGFLVAVARGRETQRPRQTDRAVSATALRSRWIVVTRGGDVLFRLPARAPQAAVVSDALRRVALVRVERHGTARIVKAARRALLARRLRTALAAGGGTVAVPERALAANVWLPIVKQALRNNCETAALSMLLWARGVKVGQLELQRKLPRSGPLDPKPGRPLPLWGDPNVGFVGRADGGGTSGGFGVYEPPIVELAGRYGVRLLDVGGGPVARVYTQLLRGRPVMVWVGLSDGPFKTWRTPGGRTVAANFGEHTVVLTGVRGDRVFLSDPLIGRRTAWTRDYFERLWLRLGRRALSF